MPKGYDTRDHEGRRPKDPRITYSQDTDEAPAHGIPRPDPNDFMMQPATEGNFDSRTEGEPDTPEDAQERADLREEKRKEHGL